MELVRAAPAAHELAEGIEVITGRTRKARLIRADL